MVAYLPPQARPELLRAMRTAVDRSAQDAIDAVLAYVQANSESRNAPAAASVYFALAAAWPCS